MKTKVISINEIECQEEFYPRIEVNWMTVYDYKESLRAGARFPLITVALFRKRYLLVDGWHRLKAHKMLKQGNIKVEILEGLSKKEIYIEAIRRNITHGKPLSPFEKRRIVLTLTEWKLSRKQITELIHVPVDKLTSFVAERLTRVTETGTEEIVKAPLKNLAGTELKSLDQDILVARSQTKLLDEVILLLEKG